jgi:hypothetical protein
MSLIHFAYFFLTLPYLSNYKKYLGTFYNIHISCVVFIFWAVFARFLSHDARITPSKTNKNISKI